ncbi:MAG: YihA family ribosome biogenesis GTP-binding protein [SAR324 cluster bacterium]|nr:YihA family ribosome biogenesis GTP-binding protein [SAR324 cluster bacterium]
MKIKSTEFVISAVNKQQFPAVQSPEIAFAGKSNVGKSSLINSLLNRKNLVKTSSTPGKTRMINFFSVNDIFLLVDLPGYGFAKVSKSMQGQWKQLVETYLSDRSSLRGVILIIDVRHGPTEQDLQLQSWLHTYHIPILIIANKVDKLKRNQVIPHLQQIQTKMNLSELPIQHSSTKKVGRKEIWQVLQSWLC